MMLQLVLRVNVMVSARVRLSVFGDINVTRAWRPRVGIVG